jgi:hypothetical protein
MDSILSHFVNSLVAKTGKVYFELGESEKIEYKQSLQVVGESVNKSYLKTICGFANNRGGVMVFGVAPEKLELVGIQDKYENLDNRFFSSTLADNVDGSFDHSFFTSRIEGLLIGFLVIKEAKSKPVILKSNFDNSGEKGTAGDIYFRYPGRTSRISFADLRTLISNEVRIKINKILNRVEYIAAQGTENIALLNTQTGELNTEAESARFILSKEILNEINFIDEGRIVQTEGAPAYVIKGIVEVANEKIVEKKVILHSSDIFTSFFSQKCEEPLEYIKELLYKDSPYYPLFYFIKSANLTIDKAIEYINTQVEHDIKSTTKNKIINRLTARVVSVARSASYLFLKNHSPIPRNLFKKHIKEVLEAFTHLAYQDFRANPEYYLKILGLFYKEVRHMDTMPKTFFRKAICMCDEALFR